MMGDRKLPVHELVHDDFKYISQEIMEEGEKLGRALGLKGGEIHGLKRDNDGHEEFVYKMLVKWQQKNGTLATRDALVGSLNTAGLGLMAARIKNCSPNEQSSFASYPQAALGIQSAEDDVPQYKMDANPRGKCLMLTYDKVNNLTTRAGNDADIENLTTLFELLHFDVDGHHDLTFADTKKVVKDFAEMDHSIYDCFICFVCSHGDQDSFMTADQKEYNVEDLLGDFKGNRTLEGKPKIFFINACRGNENQKRYESDGKRAATEGDVLIANSTVNGYTSLRNTNLGTLYVQSLCSSFKKHYTNMTLCQLLARTNDMQDDIAEEASMCQVGIYSSSLKKLVNFA